MSSLISLLPATVLLCVLAGCGSAQGDGGNAVSDGRGVVAVVNPPLSQQWKVVNTFPHDPEAWTQGLIFLDSTLYEGTGETPGSSLRQVELTTGKVLRKRDIPEPYFGEGITVLNGRLYQLTWQHGKGFVYDVASFTKLSEFTYEGEGWGLTHDGTNLIMSDGTATLRYLDPRTLKVIKTVDVKFEGRPVLNLNELEMVRGELFANVWLQDSIARIDLGTGNVTGWLDMKGLLPENVYNRYERVDVLNGIAYDSTSNRLFVTGKRWPYLYEIQLIPHE